MEEKFNLIAYFTELFLQEAENLYKNNRKALATTKNVLFLISKCFKRVLLVGL